MLLNDQSTTCTARGFIYYADTHPYYSKYMCDNKGKYVQGEKLDGPFNVRNAKSNSNFADVFVDSQIGRGGWEREVLLSQPHGSVYNQSDSSSFSTTSSIPYLMHEFGLASYYRIYGDRLQTHTTWPGFSLNPGVWDLEQVYNSFDRCVYNSTIVYNNNAQFHEYDKSFEHEWTILTHQLGLNTGYLASNYFEHIGEKVSAYVLNNYTRVWDQHRDALKDLGYLWTKTTLFE